MTRIDLCWPALKTTDNTNAFVSAVMHPPTQMLICAGTRLLAQIRFDRHYKCFL